MAGARSGRSILVDRIGRIEQVFQALQGRLHVGIPDRVGRTVTQRMDRRQDDRDIELLG